MNHRIHEIADDCWKDTFHFGPDGPETYTEFDYEKFAELIVKECVGVSLESSHRNDDMGAIIAKHIKKHFGVKE